MEALGAGFGVLGFFSFIISIFLIVAIFAIMIRTGNTVKELREIKKILNRIQNEMVSARKGDKKVREEKGIEERKGSAEEESFEEKYGTHENYNITLAGVSSFTNEAVSDLVNMGLSKEKAHNIVNNLPHVFNKIEKGKAEKIYNKLKKSFVIEVEKF